MTHTTMNPLPRLARAQQLNMNLTIRHFSSGDRLTSCVGCRVYMGAIVTELVSTIADTRHGNLASDLRGSDQRSDNPARHH